VLKISRLAFPLVAQLITWSRWTRYRPLARPFEFRELSGISNAILRVHYTYHYTDINLFPVIARCQNAIGASAREARFRLSAAENCSVHSRSDISARAARSFAPLEWTHAPRSLIQSFIHLCFSTNVTLAKTRIRNTSALIHRVSAMLLLAKRSRGSHRSESGGLSAFAWIFRTFARAVSHTHTLSFRHIKYFLYSTLKKDCGIWHMRYARSDVVTRAGIHYMRKMCVNAWTCDI